MIKLKKNNLCRSNNVHILGIELLSKSLKYNFFTDQENIQQEDPDEDDGYDQLYAVGSVINTFSLTNMIVGSENIGSESTEIITSSQNPYYSTGASSSNETDQGNIDNMAAITFI